jgi:hypothetical protein
MSMPDKAIHEKVAIPIPSYIIKPTRTSRFHHPKSYIQIRPKKDELLDIKSSEEFKSRLTKIY